MLRARTPVRTLALQDRDEALELCARDLPRNVFVAARIIDGAKQGAMGSILGFRDGGHLTSMVWANANVVPVATTSESIGPITDKMRRWRGRSASIFGASEEVLPLWGVLQPYWGEARAVRGSQPLLLTTTPPSALGIAPDPRVRLARPSEVDLILPAAEHMFTAEIGYPPYVGSSRSYRASLANLASRGHTYVVIEDGEVIFKTDLGSVALGCAQLQGVWVTPRLRGQGLSVPLLAGVIEQLMAGTTPLVSLYVNDFNTPARAAYDRLGFREVGEFSTVLL